MARLNAPRNAGDSRPSRRTAPAQPNKPGEAASKGWPFAEGSQNHLDETAALWPRPSSKPAPSVPPAGTQPE